MINRNQKAELYEIIYIPTGQKYIGITYGENHSYLKRFEKHMKGRGGVHIKNLLNNGANKKDFKINLLETGLLKDLYDKEAELSILYPEGLNGNKGHAIVITDMNEVLKKRKIKMKETSIKISMNMTGDDYETCKKRVEYHLYRRSLSEKELIELTKENKKLGVIKQVESRKNRTQEEKDVSVKKMLETLNKKSQEEIEKYRKQQSKSMKKSRKNETLEQKDKRRRKHKKNQNEKSQEEKDKKNQRISLTKQKHPENVIVPNKKIFVEKYKKMSKKEFENWCLGRKQNVITRVTNYRESDNG